MKGEKLFRAVGQVGDDLIARAEKTPARQASRGQQARALDAVSATRPVSAMRPSGAGTPR